MASLNELKFSSQAKPQLKDPIVVRRSKFMEKLNEQILLVTRHSEGHEASPAMVVEKQDLGSGVVSKHRSAWWWKEKTGKFFISFKYGSKTLELSKGRPSVQCESLHDVKKAFETVYSATDKGELDQLLLLAGSELRKRFQS